MNPHRRRFPNCGLPALAWVALAALATRITPAAIGAPLFAVACVAALAHLLDLRRHLRGVVDGAAGGSA